MDSVITKIEAKHKKSSVVDVRSGDSVRVHQKIIEGGKQRVQIFEGLIIRVGRRNSLSGSFTVRRVASGVGVEKTFLIHSPSILKVEVVKRSKVRRNYLSYMRGLTGKRARLTGVEFDKESVNAVQDEAAEAEESKIKEEQVEKHEADEASEAGKPTETASQVEEAPDSKKEAEEQTAEQTTRPRP